MPPYCRFGIRFPIIHPWLEHMTPVTQMAERRQSFPEDSQDGIWPSSVLFFEPLISIEVRMPLAGGLRWKRLITHKPAGVFSSANTNLDSDQHKVPAVPCTFFFFFFLLLLEQVEVEAAVQVPPPGKHNNDLHQLLFFVFIY